MFPVLHFKDLLYGVAKKSTDRHSIRGLMLGIYVVSLVLSMLANQYLGARIATIVPLVACLCTLCFLFKWTRRRNRSPILFLTWDDTEQAAIIHKRNSENGQVGIYIHISYWMGSMFFLVW